MNLDPPVNDFQSPSNAFRENWRKPENQATNDFTPNKKRKVEEIHFMETKNTLYLDTHFEGCQLACVIDTGATVSAISKAKIGNLNLISRQTPTAVKVGSGEVVWSSGSVDIPVKIGPHTILQQALVLDTNAFEAVLGMDFLGREGVNGILFRPSRIVNVHEKNFPLREEANSLLNYRICRIIGHESYKLNPEIRKNHLMDFQCKVDLFAKSCNQQEALYCDKENSCWQYDWGKLTEECACPLWANPPFSKITHALTKIAEEKARVMICTPNWKSEEGRGWRELLDRLTIKRVTLRQVQGLYLSDKGKEMQAPSWKSTISLVDGKFNEISREEIQEKFSKESRFIAARSKGLGLRDLERKIFEKGKQPER